jgi:hypothetical protein
LGLAYKDVLLGSCIGGVEEGGFGKRSDCGGNPCRAGETSGVGYLGLVAERGQRGKKWAIGEFVREKFFAWKRGTLW